MIKFNLKEVFWITKTGEFSETLPPLYSHQGSILNTRGGGGGGGEGLTAVSPLDPHLFF